MLNGRAIYLNSCHVLKHISNVGKYRGFLEVNSRPCYSNGQLVVFTKVENPNLNPFSGLVIHDHDLSSKGGLDCFSRGKQNVTCAFALWHEADQLLYDTNR